MTLPYDYARCMTPCDLADTCRRTDAGRPGDQAFSQFEGGDDCSGYIPRYPAPMTPVIARGVHEI